MKTKPILFSTPMVQAILEGRKIMTRRVIKTQPSKYDIKKIVDWNEVIYPTPKFLKGDILWVKETWQYIDFAGEDNNYVYKATDPDWDTMKEWKWNPSIFMPKEACRIFLKITNIKVEKLQDISEEDAMQEGIEMVDYNCFKNYLIDKNWIYKGMNQKSFNMVQDPIGSFCSLWQSINGEQSWNDNPYVWVISFERIEKPINF